MNLQNINLRKIQKEDLIKIIVDKNFDTPSSKEKKEIQKIIADSVEKGVYLIARNALILGIYYDCEATFENVQRKGLFRYSKYTSKKCIIKDLVSEILELCEQLGCKSDIKIKYLQSIINFSNILHSYNEIQEYIETEINFFEKEYKGKSLIKTLLSYIDFLFLSNHYPTSETDPIEIASRPKEDICSAVSYIIYYYTKNIKTETIDTKYVAEEFIKSGRIGRMLIAACFISDFKEFEIMIDHFNYNCVVLENKIKIAPPSEDFEKSIRLGYIKTDLQGLNDRIEVDYATSFEQIVDEISNHESFNFFKLTETFNYPRYRLEIPEPVYEIIIDKFLKPDLLFKEEIIYLAQVFKEQLLNPDDLKKIKVKDDLSLFEFIKIRRIFYLFYLIFTKQVYKEEQINTELILRSLIPTYYEDTFYDFVEKLTSIKNIDAFLDIVCWEPDLDILFDLQYHPILFFNNHFLIPLTIFINSNSIRNLFASEYKQDNKKLLSDGTIDPLVEILYSSLTKANILSFKQTPIPKSDIDLFAVFENTLFVFECKHSLHPVSTFDLRTTYDYIKKAEKQLDYINEEFKNGNLTLLLEKKYDIDLKEVNNIQSCIVLSNRLFNGNVFKYPVRNINEIDNILTRGTMRTNEGKFWLWNTNQLSLSDLLEYFSLDSKLVKLLYDSVSVRTLTYKLAKPEIDFDSYYLDFKFALPRLNEFTSNLRKVEENESM